MRRRSFGRGGLRRLGFAVALLAAPAVLTAAPAAGAPLVSAHVAAARGTVASCIARPLPAGHGVVRRTIRAGGTGFVTATLSAGSGDWDLGVFDARTGHRVAGSTQVGPDERAQGFTVGAERLVVQACRIHGRAHGARLTAAYKAIGRPAQAGPLSLVKVLVPTRERLAELQALGLDLTENGRKGYVEAVLHGSHDAARLRGAKFSYVSEVADLARQSLRDRRAEARGARVARSGRARAAAIPTGRTRYRRLDEINQELKTLAAQNPDLVKTVTLPFKTLTGRSVQGIEITKDVDARDGKPVFLDMGTHHAREWPSTEMTMEFAHELVDRYKSADPVVRRLMGSTRTIVIPVVNPDGFNTSREAGEALGFGAGHPGNDTVETANLLTPYEYQRKNCRVNSLDPAVPDPERGDCTQQPATGLSQFGVDPNRNYGGFWGGPGASVSGEAAPGGDYAQDYRGDGPFSERETQNIRALISGRQVTTLITNHTFANLVLRPPGIQSAGPPPDEAIYKALGDSMAANNGYSSEPSYQLYDTTGATEDWSYYATGGLGFTFEIGLIGFHPPYANTVAEYDGSTAAAANRGGNRAAYFKALEATANSAMHSTLAGKAPPGTILRLKKSFTTATSPVLDQNGNPGAVRTFPDTLNTTMRVPDDGTFRWAINPSTRPIAAQTRGRPASGPPSGSQDKGSHAPPAPCGAALGTDDPTCYSDVPFSVPGAPADNASATVEASWSTAASDYDLYVYTDANNDGSSAGERLVGTSAQGTTNSESTTFGEPGETIKGKNYVARVVNFAGAEPFTVRVSFGGPTAYQPAHKEAWTLTCESPGGKVGTTRQITIDRAQSQTLDLSKACAAVAPRQCVSTKGGAKGAGIGQARLGRARTRQRKTLKGTLLSDRKGIDRYCLKKGGGSLRVGYPTSRLAAKLAKKTRKRIRSRAIYLGSTSKTFRLAKLKVGSKTKTLRRRLRGERRYKVGRNVWYVAKGKRARLLFRARKSKVLELALADTKLTATRTGTVRLLRAWDKRGKTKAKRRR